MLLCPLLVPPSLPLQEVHVSKEIIGKISVASKSKPMFFSTLQTLPLRPLCDGPKGNRSASGIVFPSPVFFHTVARVIFFKQRPDEVPLLVKNLGRSLLLNFLALASRFSCCMTTTYPASLIGIPSTCSSPALPLAGTLRSPSLPLW